MSLSQLTAYSLVQECLKEALYADWRQNREQSQRYLAMAQSRLLELRRTAKQQLVAALTEDGRSPVAQKPFVLAALTTTFQYARVASHRATHY